MAYLASTMAPPLPDATPAVASCCLQGIADGAAAVSHPDGLLLMCLAFAGVVSPLNCRLDRLALVLSRPWGHATSRLGSEGPAGSSLPQVTDPPAPPLLASKPPATAA